MIARRSNCVSLKLWSQLEGKGTTAPMGFGISVVEVILEASDSYLMRFEAPEGRIVSEHEGIYNDQLRELFTNETGLDVCL
jgi:hypothetical protein